MPYWYELVFKSATAIGWEQACISLAEEIEELEEKGFTLVKPDMSDKVFTALMRKEMPAGSERRWFLEVGEKEYGPIASRSQAEQIISESRKERSDLAWDSVKIKRVWLRAEELKEFVVCRSRFSLIAGGGTDVDLSEDIKREIEDSFGGSSGSYSDTSDSWFNNVRVTDEELEAILRDLPPPVPEDEMNESMERILENVMERIQGLSEDDSEPQDGEK